MKLNESAETISKTTTPKYIFQGVFTACSTPDHVVINRNGRIYPEQEVLRHLGYLRDMIKENGGQILGELDHPEGRFDVNAKEASHKITDLWYDDKTKCVMGRLEVLTTPNGMTLRSLIDAGYPVYVSSRAAGDVNPKTKEVEIAQIFTYDVVCTPGFKEAKLERVNESLSQAAICYLNESISALKRVNENEKIIVPAEVIDETIVEDYSDVDKASLCKRLTEKKTAKVKVNKIHEDVLDVPNDELIDDEYYRVGPDYLREDGDDAASAEDKDNKRTKILSIKGLDDGGNNLSSSNDENTEKDDKRDLILSITGVEKTDEPDAVKKTDSAKESDTNDKADKEKKIKDELKKDTDDTIAELESVLNSAENEKNVKESIIARYPFAALLSEHNFNQFAKLRGKFKKRCSDFLIEHEIFDAKSVNALWMTPIIENKRRQQNWLKLASQTDIDLYNAAPISVQNAIEESAKYAVIETAADADAFWQRTGLRQQAKAAALNEQYKRKYHEQSQNDLGYGKRVIDMIEDMYR